MTPPSRPEELTMAKILAIDLGKYKSVACAFNTDDGE